eukprot:5929092-Pyramimonas_sp.AAC.1
MCSRQSRGRSRARSTRRGATTTASLRGSSTACELGGLFVSGACVHSFSECFSSRSPGCRNCQQPTAAGNRSNDGGRGATEWEDSVEEEEEVEDEVEE